MENLGTYAVTIVAGLVGAALAALLGIPHFHLLRLVVRRDDHTDEEVHQEEGAEHDQDDEPTWSIGPDGAMDADARLEIVDFERVAGEVLSREDGAAGRDQHHRRVEEERPSGSTRQQ